jgi:putative thioredoxin
MPYDLVNFDTDVLEASRTTPIVVDFWAAWCGPCRILGPTLERMAAQAEGRWQLVKVDTEAHPELAQRYGVSGIPDVRLFVDGAPVDGFVGALPEPAIAQWLDRAIPTPAARAAGEALEAAEARLTRNQPGDREAAIRILDLGLQTSPDHPGLRIRMARALLFHDHPRLQALLAEGLLDRLDPGSDARERADAIREILSLLGNSQEEVTRRLGDAAATQAGARYVEALEALRGGAFEAALDGFLDVLREDRTLDDEGARRGCLAIFRLLGHGHATTATYRSRVSSALYV